MDYELPPVPHIVRGVNRGRVVAEGYQRGWGLQYGDMKNKVLGDPLYIHAVERAAGRLGNFSEYNRMNIFLILKFFLNRIPFGHIIEFGSFRGGSAIFFGSVCQELYPDRLIYALDTFEGMPTTDPRIDAHTMGGFRDTSVEEVNEAVVKAGLSNIRLVKGLFQDTAERALMEAGSIALAHIDCDIKSACDYSRKIIRKYMVEGGYLVFDDATISSCLGETESVEEMIREEGSSSEQIWPHFVFRHGLRDTSPG